MSFIVILTITLEQYIAVCYPFFHQKNVTYYKLIVPMAAAWSCIVVTCVVCWQRSKLWVYFQSISGFVIFVTYSSVVYCYTRMFLIACHTRRRITASSISSSGAVVHPSRRREISNKKAIVTSFTIILAFTVSYLPFGVFHIKKFISGINAFERTVAYEWMQLVTVYSSVVNPLVYYWRLRAVRNEVMKIFNINI